MNSFKLNLITPEASRVFDSVFCLSARSPEGDFAVLALHEPFIFHIMPGKVKLMLSGNVALSLEISSAVMVVNGEHYTVTAEYYKDI